MALISFGLAAVAPPGIKGFAGFMQAPPGLAVIALALMAIGFSIEEMGTIRRIRLGVGLRILSVPIIVAAVLWAIMLGSPMPSLAMMGFVLGGVGAIGVGLAFQFDWATYADVRYGQPVRLVELSNRQLEIESDRGRASVAIADILAVRGVQNLDGRAVVFLVNEQARKRKDMDAVPWIGATPEGDAFVLTEHQAGMDIEQLMAKVAMHMAEGRNNE